MRNRQSTVELRHYGFFSMAVNELSQMCPSPRSLLCLIIGYLYRGKGRY